MNSKGIRNIIFFVLGFVFVYIIYDSTSQPNVGDLNGDFKEVAVYRNENNTGPITRIYAVTLKDTLWAEMKKYGDLMPYTKYGSTTVYFFKAGGSAPNELTPGNNAFDQSLKQYCLGQYVRDANGRFRLIKILSNPNIVAKDKPLFTFIQAKKMTALEIVEEYYSCFNKKDWQAMLELLHSEIRHEPNQGEERIGKEKFTEFLQMMDDSYEETLTNITFFTEPGNTRIAAEFTVNGIYKKGEEGLPEAHGQSYVLPAAAFLEVKDDKINRVTTYYNLPLWIKLVS